jgi:uncharacterized iron-regulated membrane protein
MNLFLHRLHRTLGLGAALFVILLALTGLALLCDQSLQLDRRHITSQTLLDWYAIRPPPPPLGFQVDQRWVTQVGPRLYLDQRVIADHMTALRGAIATDDLLVVALKEEVWLLSPAGERVERLTAVDGVPPNVTAIGVNADHTPVLRAGATFYAFAVATLEFQVIDAPPAVWATPDEVPAALAAAYAADFLGNQLTLERVILDLHSGRILGVLGQWIIGLSALAMLALAVTGLLSWWRRCQRQHRVMRSR